MGATVAFKTPRFLVNASELTFRDIPVVAAQLLFGLELNFVVGQLALAPLGDAGRAHIVSFTGLFGRPQMFSPIRRSSLCI